jgi:hypothetical protein
MRPSQQLDKVAKGKRPPLTSGTVTRDKTDSEQNDDHRIDYVGEKSSGFGLEKNQSDGFLRGGRTRGGLLNLDRTHYNSFVTDAGQVYFVTSSFKGYDNFFTSEWNVQHPKAWSAASIKSVAWWPGSDWEKIRKHIGIEVQPIVYDFGDDIKYEKGNVVSSGQVIATGKEYHEVGQRIVAGEKPFANKDSAGAPKAKVDDSKINETKSNLQTTSRWLPLGVFAVVNAGQKKADYLVQLAVDQNGRIRGNWIDQMTNQVRPVEGYADKTTQRVVYRLVDQKDLMAESGLVNLTEDVASVAIHRPNGEPEFRGLIRLLKPVK